MCYLWTVATHRARQNIGSYSCQFREELAQWVVPRNSVLISHFCFGQVATDCTHSLQNWITHLGRQALYIADTFECHGKPITEAMTFYIKLHSNRNDIRFSIVRTVKCHTSTIVHLHNGQLIFHLMALETHLVRNYIFEIKNKQNKAHALMPR